MSDKWVYDNVYNTYIYQGVEYSIINTETILNEQLQRIAQLEAENARLRQANYELQSALHDCTHYEKTLLLGSDTATAPSITEQDTQEIEAIDDDR